METFWRRVPWVMWNAFIVFIVLKAVFLVPNPQWAWNVLLFIVWFHVAASVLYCAVKKLDNPLPVHPRVDIALSFATCIFLVAFGHWVLGIAYLVSNMVIAGHMLRLMDAKRAADVTEG